MRQWTLAEFGTERLLEFVVLATPDDIEGNAEYISEGDFLVEVSEGPSENNYGSIPLIVQVGVLQWVGFLLVRASYTTFFFCVADYF